MKYDSQEQKNIVLNALAAYPVPLGQRSRIDPIVTQLAQGEVVPPKPVEKPAKPDSPTPIKKAVKKKGGKKK
jgi:hypothetical protein